MLYLRNDGADWVWRFKGLTLLHFYLFLGKKREREYICGVEIVLKAKIGTKFTAVPRLLLEHGGPMLPALHDEADLSLHLTMKVWYSAHGSIATSGHWDTTQLTGQNFPGLNFN